MYASLAASGWVGHLVDPVLGIARELQRGAWLLVAPCAFRVRTSPFGSVISITWNVFALSDVVRTYF